MKTLKNKVDQNLYYFTYGLFLFGFVTVGYSTIDWPVTNFLYEVVRTFTAVSMLYLTALNFFNGADKKYLLKKFCVLSVMSVLLLVSYRRSEIQCFLIWFLFAVPGEGKSIRKILDVTLVTVSAAVLVVISLSLLGAIPNTILTGKIIGKGMCLGFYHPNALGAFTNMIICAWMARRYQKFSWYDSVGIIFLTLLIYYLTGCKTMILSVVFMFALVLLFKIGEKNSKANFCAKWVVRLILPVCAVASLVISYLYTEGSAAMVLLNKALTGRFALAHRFAELYPVTLLGQRVEVDIPLDNMYVRAWLESGILVFVMMWGLYYLAMNKLFKRKEYGLAIACCVYALYGVSEVCVYLLGCNFTLLLTAQLFPPVENQNIVASEVALKQKIEDPDA